jgi:hypothetical protein
VGLSNFRPSSAVNHHGREEATDVEQSDGLGLKALRAAWQQTTHSRKAALETEQSTGHRLTAVSLHINLQMTRFILITEVGPPTITQSKLELTAA